MDGWLQSILALLWLLSPHLLCAEAPFCASDACVSTNLIERSTRSLRDAVRVALAADAGRWQQHRTAASAAAGSERLIHLQQSKSMQVQQ